MTVSSEKKQVVLVIDDTAFNLRVASNALRGRYEVRAVPDGLRALALLGRWPDVDLILLDIVMPEVDGFEICRRLKSAPATARIPVVFMSALDGADNLARAKAVGGVDFVRKPFEPDRLRDCVEKWLP